MELKFKEPNDKFKVSVMDGVMIKPFYTLQELCDVYSDMKNKETAIDRYCSKVVHTAKVCTNIDFVGISDAEIFDIVSELGLLYTFQLEIEGYDTLDKFISDISELINNVMNKIGLVDVDKTIEDITKVITDGNKEDPTKVITMDNKKDKAKVIADGNK